MDMDVLLDVFLTPYILFCCVAAYLVFTRVKKRKRKDFFAGAPSRNAPERISPLKPSNAGEGHVPTIGPDVQGKLEQLEVLKKAGLLEQEEYQEKKRKILRG